MMRAAKVFAEINTLQEGLARHTLFMQHRFNIPSIERIARFWLKRRFHP